MAPGGKDAAGAAGNKDTGTKEKCLGCGKSLTNTHCHQCTVCGLWIHKSCSGITDEFFKHLEDQVKNTGAAYWACRPCTNYSAGITRNMRRVEQKVDGLADSVDEMKEGLQATKDELKKVSDKVTKVEEKIEAATERSSDMVFEELREREARRLNLVIHGVPECDIEGAVGKDRQGGTRNSV